MSDFVGDGIRGRHSPRPSGAEPQIDLLAMRRFRLARVRAQMKALEIPALVLFDPLNIRYASGTSNMQVWTQHSPDRYLFIAAEGPVILFDNYVMDWDITWTGTVDEVRPAAPWYFEGRGDRLEEFAQRWCDDMVALQREHCGGDKRFGIDRLGPAAVPFLTGAGLELADAQRPLELARAIKCEAEIACMLEAIAVTEAGIARMREALRPGMSENALWSLLIQTLFEQGGESMETRLLASGPRTNPWYQECSDRLIRAGELVAFDTDLVGPYGICVDISRTFFCGPGQPSTEHKELYALAKEQVESNMALIPSGYDFPRTGGKGLAHARGIRPAPLWPDRPRRRHGR